MAAKCARSTFHLFNMVKSFGKTRTHNEVARYQAIMISLLICSTSTIYEVDIVMLQPSLNYSVYPLFPFGLIGKIFSRIFHCCRRYIGYPRFLVYQLFSVEEMLLEPFRTKFYCFFLTTS
jgi:hypothetical protein